MTSLFIALAIVVVVGAAALILRRRHEVDVPTQKEWTVPIQIDPVDLAGEGGSSSWSIAVFTSASCHVCADVVSKARVLQSSQVNVREFEYGAHRALHDKYRIDAVPTLVVVDSEGVVRRHFLGPGPATDLWAAVAQTRDPDIESGGDCSSR